MRKSRFTEAEAQSGEGSIGILAEQERGEATGDVCRRHGMSTTTFYNWMAKFGGMDVPDARKLTTLEPEGIVMNHKKLRKRPPTATLRAEVRARR